MHARQRDLCRRPSACHSVERHERVVSHFIIVVVVNNVIVVINIIISAINAVVVIHSIDTIGEHFVDPHVVIINSIGCDPCTVEAAICGGDGSDSRKSFDAAVRVVSRPS